MHLLVVLADGLDVVVPPGFAALNPPILPLLILQIRRAECPLAKRTLSLFEIRRLLLTHHHGFELLIGNIPWVPQKWN